MRRSKKTRSAGWLALRISALWIAGSAIVATALAFAPPVGAQTVQRHLYTVSSGLKSDLHAHGIDSGQIETVVNGIAESLIAGDLGPLLAQSAPTIRITAGRSNVTLSKARLGSYGRELLKIPGLGNDVTDDDQVIIHDGKVGLARGTIWVDQTCLDDACSKKKSEIVTINLP